MRNKTLRSNPQNAIGGKLKQSLKKGKNKKSSSFLRKFAPKIIQKVRLFAIQLKKVNSYQSIFFPHYTTEYNNPYRNQSLIDEYRRKCSNCENNCKKFQNCSTDCKNLHVCKTCKICQICKACQTCQIQQICNICHKRKNCQKCKDCKDCKNCQICQICQTDEVCKICKTCKVCKICQKCKTCNNCQIYKISNICNICNKRKNCKNCMDCKNCKNCQICQTNEVCKICKTCKVCKICDICKNWYPFYFTNSNLILDNSHLQLFNKKQDLPIDFTSKGFGKVICFAETVSFTKQNNLWSQYLRQSGERNSKNKNQSPIQSRISNKSKELNESNADKNEEENEIENILLMGTDTGYALGIQPKYHKYISKKVSPNIAIQKICIYKSHVMVICNDDAHFFKIQFDQTLGIKFNSLFDTKIASKGHITKASFVKEEGLCLLFFIDEEGLKKMVLKQWLFSTVQRFQIDTIVSNPDKFNPFTNMKLYHQSNMNRIIIVVSCTKELQVISYNCIQNKIVPLHRMSNPTKPPFAPLTHPISCIEYFSKLAYPYEGLFNIKNSHKKDKLSTQETRNSLDGYQESLFIAVSFCTRLYFLKVGENHCQVSKRVKFQHRIIKIQAYKEQGIFIFFHKIGQNSRIQQQTVLVLVTLLSKLMSFSSPIHSQLVQKIQYQFKVSTKLQNKALNLSIAFINQQILILSSINITRIKFNTWADIYHQMKKTENIQLLTFLRLLKTCNSIFLKPPSSFDKLQSFFPIKDHDCSQILLEYYYEIKKVPPPQFINEIVAYYPHLLLPFILQHKIDNLSESTKKQLNEYWKKADQRIVQQLTIAGCESEESMALSKGWMRALKKMVAKGMQIDLPLLKVSSFVVSQKKKYLFLQSCLKKQQNETKKNESQKKETQKNETQQNKTEQYKTQQNEILKKIQNYCLQMVDYCFLALQYFLSPQQIQQLSDLKLFLLTLLSPQVINNCFEYFPQLSIQIIFKLFRNQQRLNLIDQLNVQQFSPFTKQSNFILPIKQPTVSFIILSYLSEMYLKITQNQNKFQIDQKIKFKQLLMVQHAKLIIFSMNQSPNQTSTLNQTTFQFTRPYVIEILQVLINHNNEYLKNMIHSESVQMSKNAQLFQCYLQQVLVKVWKNVKNSPLTKVKTNPMKHSQIKQLIISLQQYNCLNHYLIISLMYDLPPFEFCVRILRKFLHITNIKLKQRLFDWLMEIMKDSHCKEILKVQLMNHLKSIISINKSKSRILFDLYFKNKEKDIIHKIDNDPHLQLQFLQMIIVQASKAQTGVEQEFLSLYIRLLIQEEPERLITVLQESTKGENNKIKYDLHQVLKLSLDHQNYRQKHRIQIFLYEKLGDVSKCIVSYLKIIEQLIQSYIDYCEDNSTQYGKLQFSQNKSKNRNSHVNAKKRVSIKSKVMTNLSQIEQNIKSKFDELVDLIFRQPQKKDQYLQIPLNAMTSFNQSIQQQELIHRSHYFQMITNYFGKIIIQSFEKGYLLNFNKWLKVQTKFNLKLAKRCLLEGYRKINDQQSLLNSMQIIDKSVLVQNVRQTLLKIQKCVFYQVKCPTCCKSFSEFKGEAVIFSCGHIFHSNCIDKMENNQDHCWQCISQNQIKAMINHSEISLITILNKYAQKKQGNKMLQGQQKGKQVPISTQKKRLNRLGIFDKKLGAVENEAQMLEMKLEIQDYYQNINKKQ